MSNNIFAFTWEHISAHVSNYLLDALELTPEFEPFLAGTSV